MIQHIPGVEEIIGRRTVIYGEVGSGKTRLLQNLIVRLVEAGFSGKVTVIDTAPSRINGVGGPISICPGVRYLRPQVVFAPRLQSQSAEQVLRYVKINVERIRPLLVEYLRDPTPVLAINDLTIFLQGGDLEELLNVINHAETFIGTAYYGRSLDEDYGSGVSERERRLTLSLLKAVDNRIMLG
ncbi:MAG: helicase HerA domain-containing protein [Thermoproteota archaeon]